MGLEIVNHHDFITTSMLVFHVKVWTMDTFSGRSFIFVRLFCHNNEPRFIFHVSVPHLGEVESMLMVLLFSDATQAFINLF
jgi:hypothetical protein